MAATQIPLTESDIAEAHEQESAVHEVLLDVAYKRTAIVNVVYIGGREAREWILIDVGVPGSAGAIKRGAEARFGKEARPAAIVLTHGHFDHVGALKTLAEEWDVPIYAHPLELPYLDGSASYPPPDPTVGGGLMAATSPMFPRGPVDVTRWLKPLPSDGTLPIFADWKWIHTPGHSPGHVSLWRESDQSLIVGDAFITTRQESAYAAITQDPEMHGPPMYYTPDWVAAKASVEKLAELNPELVITGHGRAMSGEGMRGALRLLAADFDKIAVPEKGRYVGAPETAETGAVYHQP